MLYRIFGPAGSGKSSYIIDRIAESVKRGRKCYYIVPEQQSVAAERRIAHALGDRGALECEVMNFERLPNLVSRKYGGLAVSYIDKGGRDLLLSLVLIKVSNELKEYRTCCASVDFVHKCASMITRFKTEGIDSSRLFELCEASSLAENNLLWRKIHDMAVIMREYELRTCDELRDPLDSLSSLARQLDEHAFFKGTDIFIDGYYTFTGVEYQIIERLCRQCRNIYITFLDDGRDLFVDEKAAAKRIASFASEHEDAFVGTFKRSKSDDIIHIERSVWGKDIVKRAPGGDVSIVTAKNVFEECEAIAAYILHAVKNGARFREITVVTANAADYGDTLEAVFSKSGIPCFLSHKEQVVSKPLFAYILSVLQIAAEDFSLSSVRRCLKSGFSPLSPEQCDFLLRYAEMWNIRGRAWYSENEWMMNPDGYDAMTESGEKLRVFINKARYKLVEAVLPLRDRLVAKGTTVGEIARAIYKFIGDMELAKKVRQRAEILYNAGDADAAMRETQVYDCMIALLDQLCLVAQNDVIAVSKLSSLIEIMCSEYSVGSIPSSADAVTVGDPRLLRADNCRIAVICGLTDGSFPSYGKSDDFFDDEELIALEGEGVTACMPRDSYIRRERLLFYVACTSMSEKLLFTYPTGNISGDKMRPSFGLLHIMSLFDGLKPYTYGTRLSDRVYSASSAKECYILMDDCTAKEQIAAALKKAGCQLPAEQTPIFDPVAEIDYQKYREFGLSPSALERYVYCPFSYFAAHIMRLKKTERMSFAERQTGTLIHKAVEEYMRKCVSSGVFVPLDENEKLKEIDRITDEFFQAAGDKRFDALTKSIKRTVKAVYDDLEREFAVCDFLPVGLEVKIGNGRDGSKQSMTVDVDGTTVYVRGVADRVDKVTVDGTDYIRVIDYKTGNKRFEMKFIDEGLDMQMPMYMFSLCDEAEAKPAGCAYYIIRLQNEKPKLGETKEEFKKRMQKVFERSGVFTDNSDVILKFDTNRGVYLPVRMTKNGVHSTDAKNKLLDDDRFDELQHKLAGRMISVAEGIFKGHMNVAPKHIDSLHDACRYCKYHGACRYEGR